MRVLFVTSNFARWEGDIHSPWAVELIQHLRTRGVEVTVCVPSYQGLGDHTIAGTPVKRFRYALARLETLTHGSGATNKIRNNPLYLALLPFYLLAGRRRVAALCRQTPWDVVHVHWPMPQGLLVPPAGGSHPFRLISTFYGADLALTRKLPGLRGALRGIVRRSQAVTAISRFTAEGVMELTGVRPAVIPYGIDMQAVAVDEPGPKPAPFEVLTVGRLIERKGQSVLIEAVAQLAARRPEVSLTVIGEGIERPRLEARLHELGMEGRARLLGRVSDADLQRAYARCDVFVLPSIMDSAGDTEGLGMVLLEAQRHGKPVVASALGGILDIVEHERSGLLVPPADAPALAAALERLMDQPALAERLGQDGRRINAARFDWDVIVEAYLRLYRGEARD